MKISLLINQYIIYINIYGIYQSTINHTIENDKWQIEFQIIIPSYFIHYFI